MGVALKDILVIRNIELDFLENKILFLDAYNILYQFLTTIRGMDGSLLTDSKGNVTSHLVGLLSRVTNLMERNIKLVFVFDGKPPELKQKTSEIRHLSKIEAEKKFLEAKEHDDKEAMKKYASRTTRLTKEIVDEAKEMISLLGIPVIQAPSEGEAQAAYMVSKGDGFAVGSQDFDSLINGATKLVRNLSITGKRKKGRVIGYGIVKPEIIDLAENLNNLGMDRNQLIVLAMIIGTDYNPGGIKGIGPKNAIKFVKKHKTDFSALFDELKWKDYFDFSWEEVYNQIKNMPVTDDYNLKWSNPDKEKLLQLLVHDHDFSEERVLKTLEKLSKENPNKQQKSLADF